MSTLYIVSTPIGNLEDITFRALETLKNVKVIFAEDTRRTGKLLFQYGLETPLKQYHEHNVEASIPKVLSALKEGDAALVSDSGTPLISDPGFKLVREAIKANAKVVSVPGASALLTALTASGLPTDKFCFRGFLPKKSGQLKNELNEIKDRAETVIYYESPYRILQTLETMEKVLNAERQIVVARELTKLHEEFIRGTINEVLIQLQSKISIRGEITLLVAKQDFSGCMFKKSKDA